MATLLRLHYHPLQILANPIPSPTFLPRNDRFPPSKSNVRGKDPAFSGLVAVPFALAESSDSPNSVDQSPLLELAESFDLLPSDYFSQLPNDLRLDSYAFHEDDEMVSRVVCCASARQIAAEAPIQEPQSISDSSLNVCFCSDLLGLKLNDAAFDLSNGPVIDQCGKELGELLLNLSRSWELADTSNSKTLVSKLSSPENSLTDKAKSALGKRLQAAGRRFQSMGQYGQGELQRIAKAMISTGKLFAAIQVSDTSPEPPKKEARMFKFGELQVAITSDKAKIGSAIGFAFGILSWQLAQGVQSIPESSLQYANDNALLLAKSLRGALLVLGYSSAVLSAFASVGLLLLARQLDSKGK